MQELWQLYDKQGRAIAGKGAVKDDVFKKALLHGGSHVWVWRHNRGTVEVLLQKRAASKRTWANLYDISAAGHIELGESPVAAALRETKEEIGLSRGADDLSLIGVRHVRMQANSTDTEHEFQWVYLLQVSPDAEFNLEESEVDSLQWISLPEMKAVTTASESAPGYVPHGAAYYQMIVDAIESSQTSRSSD